MNVEPGGGVSQGKSSFSPTVSTLAPGVLSGQPPGYGPASMMATRTSSDPKRENVASASLPPFLVRTVA